MEEHEHQASVIYSFRGVWDTPLKNGEIKVFFRKRMPREKPEMVYLYVGTPVSAIIGWANVIEMIRVDKTVALKMSSEGAIEREDLASYLSDSESVGVMRISKPHIFSYPLNLTDISSVMTFHPPQNFCRISKDDASKLNGLGK